MLNQSERNARIARARNADVTLKAIASRYGISYERVRQICVEQSVNEVEEDTELWHVLREAAIRLGVTPRAVTRAYRVATGTHALRVGRYDSGEYVQVPFCEIPPSRWHEIPSCGGRTLAILSEAFDAYRGGSVETEE